MEKCSCTFLSIIATSLALTLSDNRDGLSSQTQSHTISSNKENSPKVLYFHAVEFPKKEQAIVTDAVDGLQIKDYVLAVRKLIGPQNIKFASRISQGRVCLYLSTQELADTITALGSKVNIGSHTLPLRLLVSKAKRIILSNVCPIISHSVIEKKLLEFDITPTSQITFLRAGINEPEYAHIMSFRRQMYIKPEDVSKLPESLQINFEDTFYWIYPSSEKLTCFICKGEGHLARHCQSVDTANGTITSVISKVALNANETLPSLPPSPSSGDIFTLPEDDNINIKSTSPSKNNSEALIMPPPSSSPGCVGPLGGGIKRLKSRISRIKKKLEKSGYDDISSSDEGTEFLPLLFKMASNTQNLTLNSNLRIIFWNARSVIKQKGELQTFLQDVDILVCVESWLNEDKSFQFPGFVSFRKDRTSSTGGGIVLLIRKNIAYKEIDKIGRAHV